MLVGNTDIYLFLKFGAMFHNETVFIFHNGTCLIMEMIHKLDYVGKITEEKNHLLK
jgi:hypothetical protein